MPRFLSALGVGVHCFGLWQISLYDNNCILRISQLLYFVLISRSRVGLNWKSRTIGVGLVSGFAVYGDYFWDDFVWIFIRLVLFDRLPFQKTCLYFPNCILIVLMTNLCTNKLNASRLYSGQLLLWISQDLLCFFYKYKALDWNFFLFKIILFCRKNLSSHDKGNFYRSLKFSETSYFLHEIF